MKRFFLVLLLLCLCLSTCAADQINCFVPDQMSKTMNQILPLVIKALGEMSTSRIQDMTDYLSLSYTETEGQYMYYNNQDWNVELAFYFPGTAGVNRESQTLNFSVSKSLSETQIQALLYSFVLTVCYDNPSMDQNALIKYMVEVNSENDVYETEAGTFSFVLSDEVYHYVMVKPEKKAVQPKKTAKPAATMLLSDRNVSIRLTDVKPLVSRSYPAALEQHVELTNNTNKTLYVSVENAKVNGVQVKGIGIYNIQPKSTVNDEYIILKAETKSAEKALGSAREATMKVVAVDSSTNQTVAEKTVTLDLSGVERFTPYPSAASVTPTPKVTARPRTTVRPTTKPTARPRATAKPTPRPTPRPTAKPTATPRASAQITSLDFSERMWAEWEF